MKLRIYDPIVLAIDIRHRRLGYAVFQGHRTLLDWGQRVYPAVGEVEHALALRRLSKLLEMVRPNVVVLKRERWDRAQMDTHLANVMTAVEDEARRHSVPICLIDENVVRSTFSTFGCETRRDIAAVAASIFPELLPSVPPKRKPWQAEHPRMSVFDAIALGVAYWHHAPEYVIADRPR